VPHRLVLVSAGGWREQGLIAEADRSVLGERLRALGRVPEAQLRALYAGADLFCLPSLHEGFGLTVLEAMVQGTAVVCSDLPALREVAGEAAQFVGPHDAHAWATTVGELLGDPGRRARLGAAGAARAKLFTWERCVQETRAVYAEVLGGAGAMY
jgi:alpha-1,3-rhamnosyl/mannosyltransferase